MRRRLGVTEWRTGRDVRRRPRNCPYKNSQSLSHLRYPMDTRQLTSSQGEADGVSDGGMMLQALGGVNSPCSWCRIRGQLPSTRGREHTHTHMYIVAQCSYVAYCSYVFLAHSLTRCQMTCRFLLWLLLKVRVLTQLLCVGCEFSVDFLGRVACGLLWVVSFLLSFWVGWHVGCEF